MRKTKIICTIGPSSNHPHIIAKLIKSGMNIARLNMAHVYNYKKLKTRRKKKNGLSIFS